MDDFIRMAILENEVEAQLLDAILEANHIPHRLQSYRDGAYDGIFQLSQGWGYVEAPEEYQGEIKRILDDIKNKNAVFDESEMTLENIGDRFIKGTYYRWIGDSDQEKGLPQPPLELEDDPGKKTIQLPDPKSVQKLVMPLQEAIEGRKSIRRYSDQPLTLEELSNLLWCTQGVRAVSSRPATLRNVPSAGSRHAFETYLLINRVEGLTPGIYRFSAIHHHLIEIDIQQEIGQKVVKGCWDQQFIANSAVFFLWTAVPYRMSWRYGERGYRYLYLDAGHVCQNLYLSAESIGCGVCAVAAFDDEEMNSLLGLDGENQFLIYCAALGKRVLSK